MIAVEQEQSIPAGPINPAEGRSGSEYMLNNIPNLFGINNRNSLFRFFIRSEFSVPFCGPTHLEKSSNRTGKLSATVQL
jgi:hypothetical protein